MQTNLSSSEFQKYNYMRPEPGAIKDEYVRINPRKCAACVSAASRVAVARSSGVARDWSSARNTQFFVWVGGVGTCTSNQVS